MERSFSIQPFPSGSLKSQTSLLSALSDTFTRDFFGTQNSIHGGMPRWPSVAGPDPEPPRNVHSPGEFAPSGHTMSRERMASGSAPSGFAFPDAPAQHASGGGLGGGGFGDGAGPSPARQPSGLRVNWVGPNEVAGPSTDIARQMSEAARLSRMKSGGLPGAAEPLLGGESAGLGGVNAGMPEQPPRLWTGIGRGSSPFADPRVQQAKRVDGTSDGGTQAGTPDLRAAGDSLRDVTISSEFSGLPLDVPISPNFSGLPVVEPATYLRQRSRSEAERRAAAVAEALAAPNAAGPPPAEPTAYMQPLSSAEASTRAAGQPLAYVRQPSRREPQSEPDLSIRRSGSAIPPVQIPPLGFQPVIRQTSGVQPLGFGFQQLPGEGVRRLSGLEKQLSRSLQGIFRQGSGVDGALGSGSGLERQRSGVPAGLAKQRSGMDQLGLGPGVMSLGAIERQLSGPQSGIYRQTSASRTALERELLIQGVNTCPKANTYPKATLAPVLC